MNKRLTGIIAASAAFVAAAGIFFTVVRGGGGKAAPSTAAAQENGSFSAIAAGAGEDGQRYVVRAYQGEICVFYADKPDVPAVYTGIALSTLRQSDRELVEKGIKLDTYEELVGILEDFSS